MNRNHLLILGTCVVSLGVGYLAGGAGRPSASTSGKSPAVEGARPVRTTSRDRPSRDATGDDALAGLLQGRSAQGISGEELVEIISRLSKYDSKLDPVTRARQSYQLQLLIFNLSASQLEEVAAGVAADPDVWRTGGLDNILSAMTAKDSQRPLAWAKTQ